MSDYPSPPEKPKFDWKFFGIAMAVMVGIFGTIIGILVSKNATLDTSDPMTAPPTVTNSTNVTLGCETSMMTFEAESLVVTMSVSSSVSAVEIEYAANVFKRTYDGLLANELESQENYCDPYCRNITDVVVSSNTLTTTAQTRQSSSDCDSSLTLTFSLKGTWIGCNDTVWPGLFVTEGQRLLRKNLRRVLQEMEQTGSADSCPVCPDDGTTLGLVSPSTAQLKDVMDEYFTAIPTICELTDAQWVSASA
jgi:hypothetical protein